MIIFTQTQFIILIILFTFNGMTFGFLLGFFISVAFYKGGL